MKRKFLLLTLSIFITQLFVFAQDVPGKYTNTSIFSKQLIPGADGKIIITGIAPAKKDNYTISGQSGNDNLGSFVYTSGNQTLEINLSAVDAKEFPLNLKTTKNGKPVSLKVDGAAAGGGGPKIAAEMPAIDRFTGIAFWDADIIYKQLQVATNGKCIPGANEDLILKIVNQYSKKPYPDFKALLTNAFFKKVNSFNCKEDDFLNGAIGPTTKFSNKRNGAAAQAAGEDGFKSVTGILGSAAGIDVTKYVQAFADFLRDRIKEELTVAYVNKLKQLIKDHEELQYLLPKTYDVFTNNDVFSIPTLGPIYKSAFAEDLAGLAENFENMVFSMPKYAYLQKENGFIAFIFAYHYADLSAKGCHPADIIHRINNRIGYSVNTASAVSFIISSLNMFSDNLRDTASTGWVKKEHLNLVNKDFTNIFFGLLYEKYPDLFSATQGTKTLKSILDDNTGAMNSLFDVLSVAKTLDNRIQEFKKMAAADKGENAAGFFMNNADAITDLIETSATLVQVREKEIVQYQKWKKIIGNAIEIAKGLRDTTTNGIGKVAINSLAILAEFIKSKDVALFSKISELTKFISDMAVAKNAKDVRDILDKNAAPPHSYRVNRQSKFSFTLAAYPGIYFGMERNKQVENGQLKDKVLGVTAPLGLAFNFGTKKQDSWSVFLSMADIGAALSYRWNNDTADIPNKITLGQIFAPGIHLVYGVKNSPLSLKLGYQFAPQLRKIETDQNVIKENGDVWRVSFAVCVDIPVFIFSFKKRDN